MGKKLKKFVDKNAADTYNFRLVHRSQRDPLIANEESSKHVLLNIDRQSKLTRAAEAGGPTVDDVEREFEGPRPDAAAAAAAADAFVEEGAMFVCWGAAVGVFGDAAVAAEEGGAVEG
eukprot:m.127046 g.127046  ORF g.127046 m.127046 type:complete len:118 (-) comp16353_c1_seq4:227-580(-)